MRRPLAFASALLGLAGLVAATAVDAAQPAPAVQIHRVDEGRFLPGPGAPIFFLALGSDGRPGLEGERADAIHLIGLNPAAGAGTIVNFPRDSFVEIPGHGQSRINDAFYYGGPGLQAATVERLTGVRPAFVLTTSFGGLETMVNELGGVPVDVPLPMKDKNSGADFPAGRVHMDGRAALAFSRNRHVPDGDIRRSEHQSLLMLSMLTKLRGENHSPASTLRLVAVLGRNVRTDGVGYLDLYRLGRLALSVDPAKVRNVTMPSRLGRAGAREVVFVGPGAPALFADFRDDAVLQSH